MENKNIILMTDSYKVGHHLQYPENTEAVYSYFESRNGGKFSEVPFFGLQYILKKYLEGEVVTKENIDFAEAVFEKHFGNKKMFNKQGWMHIVEKHGGKLPVIIKAVPEGTVVPSSNVMMTVENTDPDCYWLTNYLETILSQTWYPSTVCALSLGVKKIISSALNESAESSAGLDFMLHDFGFRGVSSIESSGLGGAAHLVNFKGTDTLSGMLLASEYYFANLDSLAFSVAATEHSVMTSKGAEGEESIVSSLLNNFPTGILSVVADSYNIYNFVDNIVGKKFKDQILSRDGVFVIRPDSITPRHPTPEQEIVWILQSLWYNIGGTINSKGYKVINPKVRVLWGDGIDFDGIFKILESVVGEKFSAENIACFGMGGGLLQKINRDTQRFAFKSSAQKREGVWYEIYKDPKDESKKSKKGRLKLVSGSSGFQTIKESEPGKDLLEVVFENGEIKRLQTFDEIRGRVESSRSQKL